jgi:hypothetical protein
MKFNMEVKLVHGWKQAHVAELDHISEIDRKDGFWTILYELHHMHDIGTWIKFWITWMKIILIINMDDDNFIHVGM